MTIDEIQAELQEEIDLCNKYFIEEDITSCCIGFIEFFAEQLKEGEKE